MLPWSIQVFEKDLGSQLRLWDWLGLTEQWSTDFSAYNYTDTKKKTTYKPFPYPQQQSYGLVPQYATPLKILTAMAGIFSGGNKIRPHVVAAVSDSESGKKYYLDEVEIEPDGFTEIISKGAIEVEWILRSQADSGSSGALFFEGKDVDIMQFITDSEKAAVSAAHKKINDFTSLKPYFEFLDSKLPYYKIRVGLTLLAKQSS